jgi:hypothetical protein
MLEPLHLVLLGCLLGIWWNPLPEDILDSRGSEVDCDSGIPGPCLEFDLCGLPVSSIVSMWQVVLESGPY